MGYNVDKKELEELINYYGLTVFSLSESSITEVVDGENKPVCRLHEKYNTKKDIDKMILGLYLIKEYHRHFGILE